MGFVRNVIRSHPASGYLHRLRTWLATHPSAQPHRATGQSAATPGGAIDVRVLMQELSVEDLCATAEEYFHRLPTPEHHLAKPFASVDEAPELLTCFGQILMGLKLLPEMTVLDFAAGSCWSSRYLTQLGMSVIATDASRTALEFGRELYARNPVFGDRPGPRFMPFDGHRFDVADESVDRIVCLDAFHHLANPREVLREMARVLKPGGKAGFSEPGPTHSMKPQSQYEMRTFRVLENDIHMREIDKWSREAGFDRLELAVFAANPFHLSLDAFDALLERGEGREPYVQATRDSLENRRLFFLTKEGSEAIDSRQRSALAAKLRVRLDETHVRDGTELAARATIVNSGSAAWRPTTARVGAVLLGAHLFDASGRELDHDYFRQPLAPDKVAFVQFANPAQIRFK